MPDGERGAVDAVIVAGRAYLDIGVNIDHDSAEIGAAADYHGIYRAALAARHYNTPMQADGRLWTQNEIGAAEAAPIPNPASRAA